jgi:hypothetical protein
MLGVKGFNRFANVFWPNRTFVMTTLLRLGLQASAFTEKAGILSRSEIQPDDDSYREFNISTKTPETLCSAFSVYVSRRPRN